MTVAVHVPGIVTNEAEFPLARLGENVPHPDGGAFFYVALAGVAPSAAVIERDMDFDRHVLACVLAVAASEGGSLAERSGLSANELETLLDRHFPASTFYPSYGAPAGVLPCAADDEEIEMVRALLAGQRSSEGDIGRWLAAMVARRAMEPNHLWEDLGLRNRAELTRLLMRHFEPLASRNIRNMRWKRFFYRSMCEDDGFVMCTTPICAQCTDFATCFGEESGESRLAEARRRGGTVPVEQEVS